MRGTIMRVAAIAFAALAPYREPPREYLTVPTRICYGKRATRRGRGEARRAPAPPRPREGAEVIPATERPLSNDERERAWIRRRDAHLEHSRSRTGTGACPLSGAGDLVPRPPARGSGIAGAYPAHEHPVETCDASPPSPDRAQPRGNSPETPPPAVMQAATNLERA